MTAEQMWEDFTRAHPEAKACAYESWMYGSSDPDLLVRLTLSGKKTAAASAYDDYLIAGDTLPVEGGYNVISYINGQAACVIRTTRVYVTPFIKVTAEHARKEGEGDLSLDFWRDVHYKVFLQEMRELGKDIEALDMETFGVVCEEFELVWPERDD